MRPAVFDLVVCDEVMLLRSVAMGLTPCGVSSPFILIQGPGCAASRGQRLRSTLRVVLIAPAASG
jgi:hypothetical protein